MYAGQRARTAVRDQMPRRPHGAVLVFACALLLAVFLPVRGHAESPGTVEGGEADGYGRLIVTFEDVVPVFDVTSSTGVLVLSFDRPVAPEAAGVKKILGNYVTAVRRDPDGRAIRMALARPISVNTIVAGEKLFVDLLPQGWVGMPPGLPQEVVAALARRAEDAAKRRVQQEILEQFRSSKPVDVRLASLPTFTRFVFVFDGKVPDATVERTIDKTFVHFDRPAKLDVSGLKSRLPPYVFDISSHLGEKGLELRLTVDPEAPVRGFKEENTFVVDVTAPESADAGAAALGPDSRATDGKAASDDASLQGPPARDALADTEGETVMTGAEPPAAETAAQEVGGFSEDAAQNSFEPVRPEARVFGSTVRLTLPFIAPTSAAVFERAGALLAVFETPQPIDVRLLRKDLSGFVTAVDSWRSGDATVLRMTLTKQMLTTVAGEATSWIITLGDVMLEPGEPLTFERQLTETGEAEAIVDFPTAQAVHEIRDPSGADKLFVATAMAPTRAVPKPFNFVEFSAPKTVHGLVVSPIADDLKMEFDGQAVRIAREHGLTISEVNAAYTPGKTATFDTVRPGFVDKFDDAGLDPGAVYKLLAGLVRRTALASDEERTDARLQMAHSLLGSDLASEALAQLDLIEQEDPAALRDPTVRALRGIAMVMMHRPEEAIREFDTFGLSRSSDVALWRGVAEVERGNWRAALIALKDGTPALSTYSEARQRQFRLAAARAALEGNDIAEAAVRLAELTEMDDPSNPDKDLALLNARLSAALGQNEDAVATFDELIASSDRRLAAEAELSRAATIQKMYGDARIDKTIERLENMALAWRGDEIELGALRLLANLCIEKGDYYRAFSVMKSATVANSESATTRALQDDMNIAFEGLFLGGGVDDMSPIDALALYYDFRELTPVGRKGDEIIRSLADRMIEVDLLQQASDLLRHQVDHRLKGAERAIVAAKLAWVYLMNRKPAEAIIVLSRTRQAVLPREVAYQRLLLEARALSETGRSELALDLLAAAEGPEVDHIRAEVLWRGEHWQEAAEAFERALGAAWESPQMLEVANRTLVLRAAISYALADDTIGLQRIREKFLPKMAESPDAHAFDVVTLPVPDDAGAFSELVARVAAVDSLDAFLQEYKERYLLPPKAPDKVAASES